MWWDRGVALVFYCKKCLEFLVFYHGCVAVCGMLYTRTPLSQRVCGSSHGQGQPVGVQTEIWARGIAGGGARAKRAPLSAAGDFLKKGARLFSFHDTNHAYSQCKRFSQSSVRQPFDQGVKFS